MYADISDMYYDTLLGSDSDNYYVLKHFTDKDGYKEYGVAVDYESYLRLCYVTKEDLRNGNYQLHVVEKSPGTQTE